MSRRDALNQATAYFDQGRLFDDLVRCVAHRTESDTGSPTPALLAYLDSEVRPRLSALGFACTLIDNPDPRGGPFLIARRIESPELPTVLSYGHGDVVSGQAAAWREGLSPWELVSEGDQWFGRGTADNKGQHCIAFAALESVLKLRQGRLGFNFVWLIEMGEEAGSPGLAEVCERHRDALAADVLLASDGPRLRQQHPTLFLGSRGVANFTLRRVARQRGYHSGNWGGVLSNPATVLAHAIASLVDSRGRILVEALRPGPLGDGLRRAIEKLTVGEGPDDPHLDPDWGEPGLTAAEKLLGWNTLEVLALGAGDAQRPVNAIAPQALAHCQLRFVPGTPRHRLQAILREHLDACGFPDVAVDVVFSSEATRLDLSNAWVAWALNSIERSCGRPADLLPNLAGSLPNEIFAQQLGLPTLWVPHSYPACAQHAPNEHLLASVAREGMQIMAGLYWDLGEPEACWQAGALREPA